ncbi:MAG: 16S rRNA (guanine(527)-N(7))-methyltransferase RsmG [Actinomycetota bacterium]
MHEPEAEARLATYEELIARFGPRLDLISPRDLVRVRTRHIDDSLRALPLVAAAPPGPAVDVGSGAGLPGIPLAIADPTRHWRLLEPRERRAAFLEEAVRTLELDCEVSRMSADQAARTEGWAEAHAIATARALAPPERSFELLYPLMTRTGIAIVFAGTSAPVIPETRVFDGTILYGGRNAGERADG